MFNSKQTQLISKDETKQKTSAFVNAGLKKSAETTSGNGALKYSTTGNDFVDQFGKLGSYKSPRSFEDISRDMSTLWAQNALLTVCFVFFIRMITRVVQFFDNTKTSTVQRGAGLKHEGIFRMIWIHIHHKDTFWKNISLWISIGSWKDIITMLSYDLQYNGWKDRKLDWDSFGKLILAGLENPNTVNLVKKYLPQIKSNSQCTTLEAQADNIIAKWICSLLFGSKETPSSYKKYRKLKASGTAHQWQQLISQRKHNLIDFNTVHGRALSQLVSSKYLKNQGLEAKYQKWIESKPIAKFTGYVHELFHKLPQTKYQIDTLNAQFNGLVETAKKNATTATSMIVVRDTSYSMRSFATGTNMACYNVAKALALFFSEMLPNGAFANSWIEFNSSAKMRTWKGSTPYEKWTNDTSSYIGSTNFQSVIKLFCNIKEQGISESEFPTGIICISDSEFNPAGLNKTNVQTALSTLRKEGFSEEYVSNFKIVLWNLQSKAYGGAGNKFETYGNVPNVYYFSGFDGSIVAFLTGVEGKTFTPSTAEELFLAAMDQEILKKIVV
jgi:hypothetical protein